MSGRSSDLLKRNLRQTATEIVLSEQIILKTFVMLLRWACVPVNICGKVGPTLGVLKGDNFC